MTAQLQDSSWDRLLACRPPNGRLEAFPTLVLVVTGCARLLSFAAAVMFSLPAHADEAKVDFVQDVAPIFQRHCLSCHQSGISKGDVSLATFADLKANAYVVAGDPDGSHLIGLIAGVDGEPPEMPKDGDPLSEAEVKAVRRWIEEGADWPQEIVLREKSKADDSWWSLQPLKLDAANANASIDDFVRAKLAANGLTMNQKADRRTLIRRATYDLIGLPPTPAEVESFLNSSDPNAYESLIERLLASPHYGERWGRHWLDVVRFGESIGFERNVLVNELWPFRDYVIRSLNEDKPFDQLIREHIAGDVFGKDNPDIAIGSAFLVSGPYDDVGNQDAVQAAQIRANTLDEMIRATSEAFLGITLGCARCHDHKFDPIQQEDYYRMYATFAGVRHGRTTLATPQQRLERGEAIKPLNKRKAEIESVLGKIDTGVMERANKRIDEFQQQWIRPAVDRTGTKDKIAPTLAKFVRLVCEGTDTNPAGTRFKLDEFEIWSAGESPRNVALASGGAKASGKARINEDFPGVYGAHLAIDGKSGERFISASNDITVELPTLTKIDRIVFSSAKGEANPAQGIFGGFPSDYRIEVSQDGKSWTEVANGKSRKPVNDRHKDHRLRIAEITADEVSEQRQLRSKLAKVNAEIGRVPALPVVWMGTRNANDAKGPFHVFVGGSPQKKGDVVLPASLSTLSKVAPTYELMADSNESARRLALADWIADSGNPLTARVLANRLWHYHFGTGIVDTPSDLGYMGGRPTHPQLLDFLAIQLKDSGYRIKAMHRMIMLSDAYQQSSESRSDAAKIDGNSRLLWRFPPRRLSAEELRDTLLQVAGKLNRANPADQKVPDSGPGFRLYRFMQDNVATYSPLDQHGPETYRRAIYHQNARASVVDLMTDFDQPDCTFSAPRRAATTTPLQALTMLNHSFTLDMAVSLSERLKSDAGNDGALQIQRAFQLCYSRPATAEEVQFSSQLIHQHGLAAFCRAMLNTSELIYLGPTKKS